MPPLPLIIDCDPGVDDAVALFLAFASPRDLEVLAVTTVGGNVAAALTARNARLIRQLAGRSDMPIYAGAEAPLERDPVAASHFHGESGLGRMAVFEPEAPSASGAAADAIVEIVMSRAPGSVSIAATGPLTNLALAFQREPAVARQLDRLVIMGGARREGGNITASAEYNIFADPHAADVVLRSGAPLILIGLDATHQVRATPQRIAALRALGRPAADHVTDLLDFAADIYRDQVGAGDPPLHDPCTIAWLLAPQLFRAVPADIQVETASPLTQGHTAVEFRVTPDQANAQWVVEADADGIFALLTERLGR